MKISKKSEGNVLTVDIEGRIDTVTAPQLEAELKLEGVKELTLGFAGVEYISSAGLRLLVKAYKELSAAGGTLKIAGARPVVREVFDITGFADKFTFI